MCMLQGVRIYTSDSVWRQVLTDLNATVLDVPTIIDLNFDKLGVAGPVSPVELKALILKASDETGVVHQIFGKAVSLSHLQQKIVVVLYKTGGLSLAELKSVLGYGPDMATHTIENAIYQLRKTYGRDFIINNNGVYKIGRI